MGKLKMWKITGCMVKVLSDRDSPDLHDYHDCAKE
jgi:hypothetical protein